MDTRRRNRKVLILAQAAGTDGLGQPNGAWATFLSPWANVRYLSGTESIKANAVTPTARASIRIGYRADVTTAMRVQLGATVFEILAVLPDEQRKEHTDLDCKVVLA
ncbi:phage head closure protein [uncultured Ramlibacter sp.]|uniref:phage head closure protein n=1 Tax=uncultured Ramlibacter sp. TaxID=260755 RepID=UPI00261A24EF|nr:phage head closure protein [uncultured Ramlibacter sp.]